MGWAFGGPRYSVGLSTLISRDSGLVDRALLGSGEAPHLGAVGAESGRGGGGHILRPPEALLRQCRVLCRSCCFGWGGMEFLPLPELRPKPWGSLPLLLCQVPGPFLPVSQAHLPQTVALLGRRPELNLFLQCFRLFQGGLELCSPVLRMSLLTRWPKGQGHCAR